MLIGNPVPCAYCSFIPHVTAAHVRAGPSSRGIEFDNAEDLVITNASLELRGGAATGPLPSAAAVAIAGANSARVRIDRVRARGASAGVYLVQCNDAQLSLLEAHNMRGPFPRGQCVQVHCIACLHRTLTHSLTHHLTPHLTYTQRTRAHTHTH